MKKKSISHGKFTCEVFRTEFNIVYANDIDEGVEFIQKNIDKDIDERDFNNKTAQGLAFFGMHDEKDVGEEFMTAVVLVPWGSTEVMIPLIAHEFSHMIDDCFEWLGVKTPHTETRSHFLDYCVRNAMKYL